MTPRPHPAVKWLPSLGDFAFLMPILFVFGRMGGTKTMLGDGDTGWHIRTGEWILANGRVPAEDIFSFSRPGQPWFAWEWLWDVAFAALFRWGGLALVVLVNVVLVAVTFHLLYRYVARQANPLIALTLTMIAAIASSIHWLARPHLFTLLFAVVFSWLLTRVSEGETKLLWWLPALTVLWTNLHGGFFVGIILVGAYAAGEGLRAAIGREASERQQAIRAACGYLAAAAGCLVASLVNPYTWRLHQHVVEYLADSYQKEHIVEFLSLNFHHPAAPYFEILLLTGAVAAIWHAGRGDYRAAVLVGVWAHGALLSARNIPIFAIVSLPLTAAWLQHGLDRMPELEVASWLRRGGAALQRVCRDLGDMERIVRFHVVSVAGLVVVGAILFSPNPPKSFRPEFDPKVYPAAALKAVPLDPKARVFTNDEWGDYLIFRLFHQGNRVFVDGRSDFYGRDFEKEYLDVVQVKYGWEKTLRRFGIDTILLPTDASLAGALKESSRWRVVYDDGITLVFRPTGAPGAAVQASAAQGGTGRDREITKTEASDRTITVAKPTT
jgi:hypothetical protein